MSAIILFFVAALAPVDTPRDEELKKELARLQGVWTLTAREARGRVLANPTPDRYTLVIAGNSCEFYLYGGTLTVDPAKRPPTLDLAVKEGRYQGRTLPGVYELSGATLKVALPTSVLRAERRPEGLRPAENSDFTVYTFERDARASKDAAGELKRRKSALAAAPPAPASTPELLQKILERLDKIDQRLDALEKKTAAPEKK